MRIHSIQPRNVSFGKLDVKLYKHDPGQKTVKHIMKEYSPNGKITTNPDGDDIVITLTSKNPMEETNAQFALKEKYFDAKYKSNY